MEAFSRLLLFIRAVPTTFYPVLHLLHRSYETFPSLLSLPILSNFDVGQ